MIKSICAWTISSVVKNTCYSCKGPRLMSFPTWQLTTITNSRPKGSDAFSQFLQPTGKHIYLYTNTYTHKIIFKNQKQNKTKQKIKNKTKKSHKSHMWRLITRFLLVFWTNVFLCEKLLQKETLECMNSTLSINTAFQGGRSRSWFDWSTKHKPLILSCVIRFLQKNT